MKINFIENKNLKEKPDFTNLGFGKYFTDYMFVMDYVNGTWINPTIMPYGPIAFDPASIVLHYALETFEGMKAYKNNEKILLFRPQMNARRMQNSNKRLCMPIISEEDFIQAINDLVKLEQDWIPTLPGTSLYIRPFMFAYENKLGVHEASCYKFMVILSPVGSYYAEGLNPVKIYVEDEYVRAVKGGTGFAKCGGNYASSIIAQSKAEKLGYTQVLWLDGQYHKYVEEVGTMNAFFIIDDEIITAPIDGSVLPGVTRDSILTILRKKGYLVSERLLSIEELMKAGKEGRLKEAFGTGTAAVISPIGVLHYKGETIEVNEQKTGFITQMLYDTLTSIQNGTAEDIYNWTYRIK